MDDTIKINSLYFPSLRETRKSTFIEHQIRSSTSSYYFSYAGVFTAPVKGVYYIRFTASDAPQPGDIGVYMYKNDQRIIFNYAHNPDGNRRFVVNAVTLELEVGDMIMMHLPSGRALYDSSDNLNTFSGFLLFPM